MNTIEPKDPIKPIEAIEEPINTTVILNSRGQNIEDVKKSVDEYKQYEKNIQIYIKTLCDIDLIQEENQYCKYDFTIKDKPNIHIEYKTINLNQIFNSINDVKIYDLTVIGVDKIDYYIELLEHYKKHNILKHFYYIVGYTYHNKDSILKIKYMYCYLDLYKIVIDKKIITKLTSNKDNKPHYGIPKKDFHILKHFNTILNS